MAQAIQPVSQPTIMDGNRAHAADRARIARLGTPPTTRKGGGVSLAESFSSALHNLSANVTRTILTMLGIIIGVASVIALLAYGNGVVAKALTALERNGTNLITIQGASQSSGGVATGNQSQTLTLADATALADPTQCPDCGAVSPEVQRGGQITANGKNAFGAAIGVWPAYADVHAYNVTTGSFIADSDVTGNQAVVVLGAQIAQTLFGSTDPTGQTIRLSGNSFKVIGVMEAKGGNGFGSLDTQVYVPITTAMAKLTGGRGGAPTGAGKVVSTIYVKATSANTVNQAISEVNTVLGGQHNTKSGAADWSVTNQQDQLQAAQDTQKTYQIFLFVIASISLLVGGIGIMNIMLVSVTERTREIGIRKAIGAKKRDILTQFVTEAVLMSLIGALTGVALGVVASYLVARLYQPTLVSVQSIFIAVGFAVMTGLFFGVYPAQRAASLRPIDALRYE
ncbi:MAG: ABC transporter permease [Chloroflexota bacterium]|nr:ABC transporter permease [Chloroflexota bacterium]